MSGEAAVQFEGSVSRDPSLGQTHGGKPVTTVAVGVRPRVKRGEEWVDGDWQSYDVEVYGDEAENVVATLTKGTRVAVVGVVKGVETYDRQDGTSVPKVVVSASSIAVSLRFATAQVQKRERGSVHGQRPAPQQQGGGWPTQQPAGGDVWGAPATSGTDETPW